MSDRSHGRVVTLVLLALLVAAGVALAQSEPTGSRSAPRRVDPWTAGADPSSTATLAAPGTAPEGTSTVDGRAPTRR